MSKETRFTEMGIVAIILLAIFIVALALGLPIFFGWKSYLAYKAGEMFWVIFWGVLGFMFAVSASTAGSRRSS